MADESTRAEGRDEDPTDVADVDPKGGGADEPEGSAEAKPEPGDWQAQSRRHERQSKQLAKRVRELERENDELRTATQTEHERAVEQARREAADAARAEATGEIRAERLSAAIVKHAAGRFAYPEDVERLLDLDPDAVFDESNRVQADQLTEALDDLIARRPKLAAEQVATPARPTGDADAGKGSGAKDPASMTVEEHYQASRRHK